MLEGKLGEVVRLVVSEVIRHPGHPGHPGAGGGGEEAAGEGGLVPRPLAGNLVCHLVPLMEKVLYEPAFVTNGFMWYCENDEQ